MLSCCIPLQQSIVYGPIISRRLGRSLGLNILSPYQKICSFDCVYCQYGATNLLTDSPGTHLFYGLNEIERELVKALRSTIRIDHVTLSGNGEPTLHPLFLDIVKLIRLLIYQERPSARLALFSNSTRLHDQEIIQAISLINEPILKLDTVNQDEFLRINRPAGEIQIQRMCNQLSKINGITIQTLFVGGNNGNSGQSSIDAWINELTKIRPKKAFIYSSDYDFEGSEFCRLKPRELLEIKKYVMKKSDIEIIAFWAG